MDKINGDLKTTAVATNITEDKLYVRPATPKNYSPVKRSDTIYSNKKLSQRKVVEVDNQFCKLSVTRSDNYKKVLDLLMVRLKQESTASSNEIELRRTAHTILQLYLPKKQNKAKQTLIEILKDKGMLELIVGNSSKNCIEIAYEYLLKNQNIPESYLQNEIYQYLADQWFADTEESNTNKLAMIKQHAKAVDITTAKNFTFKRFLRLKKRLAQYYGVPASYKDTSIASRANSGVVELDPPKESKYYLDDTDKAFINKQITNNSYAKTHNLDLLHRIKRKILQRKKYIA